MPSTPVPRHQFPLEQIAFFVQHLVLRSGIGLRGAARVVGTVVEWLGLDWEVPAPTTGRSWLLRIGLYKLVCPKPRAADWVWLVDHTVQIGQERCLVVLGIRLSELPPPGECLRLEHLDLLALLPVAASNKQVVHQQLEQTAARTGTPRAVLGDHGGDLQGGVDLFCQAHPQTSSLYDVAHKAARLLKSRLERDVRWKAFCTRVGQTKFQAQQTELAFLVPPSQRSKARYMNLESLLRWGRHTLAVVEQPPAAVLRHGSPERLEEKFGWLREFRQALALWSEYQDLLQTGIALVRRQGYSRDTAEQARSALQAKVRTAEGGVLREEFAEFLCQESAAAHAEERLPGSSEILESSFGRFKALEGEHQKGGFTSLLPALGALVGQLDLETIRAALLHVPGKHVRRWITDHLGETLLSKRRLAYQAVASSATKSG